MIEFADIGDLPVAPRRTPAGALWAMLAVAIGGTGVLVWTRGDDELRSPVAAATASAPITARAIATPRPPPLAPLALPTSSRKMPAPRPAT
jgi:hypothetical protein